MIVYEDMKLIEHVPLHPICIVLSWCAYANTVILSYLHIIEHIEVADEFIT